MHIERVDGYHSRRGKAAVSGCSAADVAPEATSETEPLAADPLVQAIAQAKDPSSTIQA